MSKVCDICGKKHSLGYKLARRGLPKRKGGVGLKITGKTRRRFSPNLQRVKANVNGTVKRIKVCVACIRSGRVTKAVSTRPPAAEATATQKN
jgi:large subunit ribosomal protein L28